MVKFFAPVPKLLQPHRHTTQSAAYQAQQASLNLLRSEEHTSELQSQSNLVCRLLLEKNTSVSTFFQRTAIWKRLCLPLISFLSSSVFRPVGVTRWEASSRMPFSPSWRAAAGWRYSRS